MNPRLTHIITGLALATTMVACGNDDTPNDQTASTGSISILQPATGTEVAGALPVSLAADGVSIEPSGEVHEGAGHFHLIADAGCIDPGTAIPRDADHVHLGDGSADATIYLEPGEHELCAQIGDGAHVAAPMTATLVVAVAITDMDRWCTVAGEMDGLLTEGDINSDDFATMQTGAENIRRLLAQLTDALDLLETTEREAVQDELDFGDGFVHAILDAPDADAAMVAIGEFLQSPDAASNGTGAAIIQNRCNVDLTD